jgi:zinc transporter ZupT
MKTEPSREAELPEKLNPYQPPQRESESSETGNGRPRRRSYVPTIMLGGLLGIFLALALSPFYFRLAMRYLEADEQVTTATVLPFALALIAPALLGAVLLPLLRAALESRGRRPD